MKAKKSLGQNFFINKNLGDHISNIVKNSNGSHLVEIGPGLGFFTEKLATKFEMITLVEKDIQLSENLKTQFRDSTVYNEDFLSIDLTRFENESITYFGSLPYNVSKPIIKKIIQDKSFTNTAYFIVQKEVAEKYLYKEPYNILSLTTAIYAKVEKLFDISPDSFRPRPKVQSSFIAISPKSIEFEDLKKLEDIIHMAFRQPRKNLKNNLRGMVLPQEYQSKRPAELSLHEYSLIANQ